jgi:bifunctional UDP-N-acetylglucosamine pyrophosphorylase / glucosamine-1-phosphate N-acetyltransferase
MNLHVCVLAAGQSKRMQSKVSKVLHPLCGRPLILHVLKSVEALLPVSITAVVGHQRDQILETLGEKTVDFVVQEQQLGTAHALGEYLKQKPQITGQVLVLNGDTPLIPTQLLQQLVHAASANKAELSLFTTELNDPTGYGRILRNSSNEVEGIVEEADASESQRKIPEINAGVYLFDIESLRNWIPRIEAANKQKEFYLTDVVALALQDNKKILAVTGKSEDLMGINTRVELAEATRLMRRRINNEWMMKGVTMIDPETTYIDVDVRLASDVVIHPNVHLEGECMIGGSVTIYPNCRIINSWINVGCVIYENTSIDSAHLESGVKIGPFARVRPDTVLGANVRIGNFVELKKTSVGDGSKANHLSYLGDSVIGKNVNVGAGTITCNYDGEKKHQTIIEDEVFVGSDTQLVAPVKVGKGAYIAAGSSITEDVPPESLAIARSRQTNIEGWVKKKKSKIKDKK